MCSEALRQFRELIRKDNKWPPRSRKFDNERRNLVFWFVDNCPSNEGPANARGFDDYGISHPSDYKRLKNRILAAVNVEKGTTYKYCKSGEMENLIDDILDLYNKRHKAVIFFSKGKNEEMDSLYIRIRNSFAHGNYYKVGGYYILWNETGSDSKPKKLGSFMVLKYDHLRAIYGALEQQ